MSTVRSTMLASAFALTVAAAATGATFDGQTHEAKLDEACAHTTWPTIPAACLTGALDRPVRIVPINGVADRTMSVRFAAAFE